MGWNFPTEVAFYYEIVRRLCKSVMLILDAIGTVEVVSDSVNACKYAGFA